MKEIPYERNQSNHANKKQADTPAHKTNNFKKLIMYEIYYNYHIHNYYSNYCL